MRSSEMGFLRWGALCSTSRWDRIGRGFGPLRASGAAVCEMCSSHLGRVSSTVAEVCIRHHVSPIFNEARPLECRE